MQDGRKKCVTLVLGGVRSGKSRYAQEMAGQAGAVTLIATAERRDDAEMNAKIDRHQEDRPAGWVTVEEPLRVAAALETVAATGGAVVVDCLTMFAANLLEAVGEGRAAQEQAVGELCRALEQSRGCVILVSNEVGSGVVPAYASGRRFRDLAGEINQRVAAVADTVVLMVAGLPLVLKGSLATGVAR